MKSNLAIVALLASMILPLTACDQVDPEAELAQRRQARVEAEVEKQYHNFEQLLASGRADLALNIADHVLKTYPNSKLAPKFKEKVEPLRAQIVAERETRRLDELWVYHDEDDAEAGAHLDHPVFGGDDMQGALNFLALVAAGLDPFGALVVQEGGMRDLDAQEFGGRGL